MKLLNLGCGNHYHKDWVNIDFVSRNENVIAHDLKKGIPFANEQFDVVYHSHVLEHFSKQDGERFLIECFRVLKPKGIIRIAVPDLEEIVKLYLENSGKALKGDTNAAHNYNWMMLEMFDQTVRNCSGGEMAKYLYRETIPNADFVYSRLGDEAKGIRDNYLKNKSRKAIPKKNTSTPIIKKIFNKNAWKHYLKKKLFANDLQYIETGKFRLGGEIHQWMYDRYSLANLLEKTGFKEVKLFTYNSSRVLNWYKYGLDEKNREERKPDSLYMEAIKQ